VIGTDGTYLFHWDASNFVAGALKVGVYIFLAGTILSVWSGCRYVSRNSQVVFGDDKKAA
jgi:hypothetical protein